MKPITYNIVLSKKEGYKIACCVCMCVCLEKCVQIENKM